jgi:HTH DNA binding domain
MPARCAKRFNPSAIKGRQSMPKTNKLFATVHQEQGPLLIRAGRAARDWMNRPGIEPRNPVGIFLAACLWREKNRWPIALPFWSAPEARLYRLDLRVELAWMADFLECLAAAAQTGHGELERLRRAEEKGRLLGCTTRSRLPDALATVIRAPIITVRDLADMLDITSQAALGLLRELVDAGIIRDTTGRASWRAFALI